MRAIARDEPAHVWPEIEAAFLMDRFGVLPGTDYKTIIWAPRILRVYRIHRLAGTPRQNELTKADWDTIKELMTEDG